MRERLRDSGAQLAGWVLLAATIWMLMYLQSGGSNAHRAGQAASTALTAVGALAVVTTVSRHRERKPYNLDRESWRAVDRAVRTGTPPEDRSLDSAVLDAIDARREALERDRSHNPWFFGVLAIGGIVMGFFHVMFFGLAALFAIAAATNHIAVDRSQARLDRLADYLGNRSL